MHPHHENVRFAKERLSYVPPDTYAWQAEERVRVRGLVAEVDALKRKLEDVLSETG